MHILKGILQRSSSTLKNVKHFSKYISKTDRVCPRGLDCSKYEFAYIGKIKETECCEQYVKNLVEFYTEEDQETVKQTVGQNPVAKGDSPTGC